MILRPTPPDGRAAPLDQSESCHARARALPLAAEAILAQRSLREFVRQSWHVMTPSVTYQHGWHIDAICEHLEAVSRFEIKRLMINVPPRHAKSTLAAVAWPAWLWITQPETRWLFASYAESLSRRDSVACRDLIQSDWYQERWSKKFRLATDQNTKVEFANSARGYRLATSVGGSTTGKGGDIIVCDDPHNLDEVHSDAMRGAVIRWWRTAMSTRVNDPNRSAYVVIMQRGHQDDLAGSLLGDGGWEHLSLPAEHDKRKVCVTGLGWEDPRTEDGELLWPDRFGRDIIQRTKLEIGSYNYAAQFLQTPTPRGGGIIKEKWLGRYYGGVSAVPAGATWIQSWDCTFKGNSDSDFVVGQVWARKDGIFYLVDQVRGRFSIVETMGQIVSLSARYPQCRRVLVEDKANGPAAIRLLRDKIPGLTPWPEKGKRHPGKIERVHAVSPLFESGSVVIPDSWSGATEYVDELTAFPHAKHDDQVDSTTQALLHYTQSGRVVVA